MSLNVAGLLKFWTPSSLAALSLATAMALSGQAASAQTSGMVGLRQASDASDFVLPSPERQAQCMLAALKKAGRYQADVY